MTALPADEPSLVGAWRFEKEVDTRADGTRVTVGPKDGYDGFLLYTSDGRMMVQIMPRGRKWSRSSATPEQLRATVDAGDAYYGRYTIDSPAGSVTHHVESSLDPSEEGTQLTRHFRLAGDTLVLAGSWEYGGEKLNFEITWARQRAAPQPASAGLPPERVTGIGGVFFKARDPKALSVWYHEKLGVAVTEGAEWSAFEWRERGDPGRVGTTVWALFRSDSQYFAPSQATSMVNYRVRDLDRMLAQLRAQGVRVDSKVTEEFNGKFAWVVDPEGNKIELWEPKAGY